MPQTPNKRPPTGSSKSPIPPPFTQAPANLEPFLSTLSKSYVYITHIDRHPSAFKRLIFGVPVLLNTSILALLSWRAYVMIPYYFALILSTLGYHQYETVIKTTTSNLLWTILKRAFSFLIDYLLITIVSNWPMTFFLERPHNPITWRWTIGFRDAEIIVRRSRHWKGGDLVTGVKKGGESPFFKTKVLPAVDEEMMRKTGYGTANASWDLDFAGMVCATGLVDGGVLSFADFYCKVFVWQPSGTGTGISSDGQWIFWDKENFGRDLAKEMNAGLATFESKTYVGGRDTILRIQEWFGELGKEELFFKWLEILKVDATRVGGSTVESRLEAEAKVAALFEEYGVDVADFERATGGIQERVRSGAGIAT